MKEMMVTQQPLVQMLLCSRWHSKDSNDIAPYTGCVSGRVMSLLVFCLSSFCILRSPASCMFPSPLRVTTGGSSTLGNSRSNRNPRSSVRDEGEAITDRQFSPFLSHTHITVLSTTLTHLRYPACCLHSSRARPARSAGEVAHPVD